MYVLHTLPYRDINDNNNLTAQLHFYTVDPDAHKMIRKSPKHFMVYTVKSSLYF